MDPVWGPFLSALVVKLLFPIFWVLNDYFKRKEEREETKMALSYLQLDSMLDRLFLTAGP